MKITVFGIKENVVGLLFWGLKLNRAPVGLIFDVQGRNESHRNRLH